MNALANKILTSMTSFKNFLLGEKGLASAEPDKELMDRLDMKLFFVIQKFDQNTSHVKKSSSSQFNTQVSDGKFEYSINDLIKATDKELNGKIFTMDKALSGKNMDDMVGKDFDFKKEIKDV